MRVAAIDLGSNSFHMLIAEVRGPSTFEVVVENKMMIQLGKRALVMGLLDPQAMEAGLRCLDEFRRLALARRVERTVAVATSAIRESENGEEFLRRAREEIGIAVRVISGKEEARLIHGAVCHHVDLGSNKALLVDIGGGSIELTVGDASKIFYTSSVKLGFLRLHGRFVTSDPMSKREAREVSEFLQGSLKMPLASIRRHEFQTVVGTSGSITTLLRLAQQRRGGIIAEGPAAMQVSREELREILSELMKVPARERGAKFDLDPLRAEFLPTALLTLNMILEFAGSERITVCPVALREGLIYDMISRTKPIHLVPPAERDLRLRAVVDLALRCDYPAEHSHQVARLAGQIFQQTSELHGLGEREGRLLEYAAILHDLGYQIGYSQHHKHAYYLVTNCDLRGFSPEERNILAHLVRYHRRAAPKKSHESFGVLDAKTQKVIKCLTAILRIADGLDQSHFSDVEAVKVTIRKKKLQLQVSLGSGASFANFDLWSAKRHARYFEKLFKMKAVFTAKKPAKGREVPPLSVSRVPHESTA
jgi:exopolyphosphatase/guanosine-5'-triphosphate,3'-diphosphate pyrophosphatase